MSVKRLAAVVLLCACGSAARAVTFFPAEGFEDDVDLAVAPNREFLVVPIEGEAGNPAFLDIYDLDAATGSVLLRRTRLAVPGWENGVDPIVVTVVASQIVVAPLETEDGANAELRLLQVAADGSVTASVTIPLGSLGFEDDVDPIPVNYVNPGVVVPLESESGTTAGLVAVKLSAADFGRCTVVANAVLDTTCADVPDLSGRLTGFLDGLDAIELPGIPDRARVAAPVAPAVAGGPTDVVFFDFDFSVGPGNPIGYFGSQSVRARNAGGEIPLPFPGFEREVDLGILPAPCGGTANRFFVPVEAADGNGGDLYLVEGNPGASSGQAAWRYALANPSGTPPILGWEKGVDIVPWCDAAGVNTDLLALAVENGGGTDADLLLVAPSTGLLVSSVEAATGGGFTILGWEKGVEPLRWTASHLLLPVDDERGKANLLAIDATGFVAAEAEDRILNPSNVILGYERSVDPLVLPVGDPDRRLWVAVETQDQGDADLRIFGGIPPDLTGSVSVEAANPGITVSGYERDVDPTIVEKADGYEWIYVPEERPTDHLARLRVQEIPPGAGVLLVLPTESVGAAPSGALDFVRPAGTLAARHADVYGYERGLDPVAKIGDTLTFDPPAIESPAPGRSADADDTITAERSIFGDEDGDGVADGADCAPLEGEVFAPPAEVTGLRVDKAATGGAALLHWDDQGAIAGRGTRYDVASGSTAELRADGGYDRIGCLYDRLGAPQATDARPAPSGGFYYLVRARNLCGTGSYEPAGADAENPCP